MPPRSDTPSPPTAPIITGHFRESSSYATWRRQGTQDYLLVLTLHGAGRYRNAAGSEVISRPGDISLLRPGVLHDYGTAPHAKEWELIWAHFLPRPHWRDFMDWPEAATDLPILSLGENNPTRQRAEEALWAMHRYATGGRPRRTELAMNSLEAALLCCDEVNPQAQSPDHARLDPRIRRVMEHLQERLSEPVSLPQLAEIVHLSPSRLSHLFKEQTGQSPGQFVERERIARAKQLLALTARTVAAVATEVGFENPFYFTLRFKKHTGLSPREWRSRANGKP